MSIFKFSFILLKGGLIRSYCFVPGFVTLFIHPSIHLVHVDYVSGLTMYFVAVIHLKSVVTEVKSIRQRYAKNKLMVRFDFHYLLFKA